MLSFKFRLYVSPSIKLRHLLYYCGNNCKSISRIVIVSLLLLSIWYENLFSRENNFKTSIFINAHPTSASDTSSQLKLNCTPGEKRLFKYDSFTKFWGNSSQTVNLNADIAVYCMEINGKLSTLKYFVEIVNLVPNILNKDDTGSMTSVSTLKPVSNQLTLSARDHKSAKLRDDGASLVDRMYLQEEDVGTSNNNRESPNVEPILEEIGEMSVRVKRSVSGWFSNTWDTVKDFFGKMFNNADGPHEVTSSTKSHSDDFGILGQCKPGDSSSSSSSKGDLPFDESIFDDVAPSFKIGANREYGTAASENDHSFGDNKEEVHSKGDKIDKTLNDHELNSVSFFDKPTIVRQGRHRRDTEASNKSTANNNQSSPGDLFKLPFEFIQTSDGKIIDVRFSHKETDLSIKNFKRHICDLFATHLDRSKPSQMELTPVGKHVTKYFYDDGDGKVLQESLKNNKNTNTNDRGQSSDQGPMLTRVLAVIGMDSNGGHSIKEPFNDPSASSLDNDINGDGDDEQPGRQLNVSSNNNNDSKRHQSIVAIIRDINSTDSIRFGSQAMVHDMSQFRINVKQIQQISANQMISTAGQLSMSLVKPKKELDQDSAFTTNNRFKRATGGAINAKPSEISIGIGLNDEDLDVANLLHVSTSFSMKLTKSSGSSLLTSSVAQQQRKHRERRQATTNSDDLNEKRAQQTNMANNLNEIHRLESQLKMISTSVVAESASQDGQLQRLDLLRDQVALRLNEEATMMALKATGDEQQDRKKEESKLKHYDSGLGLTQIILDYGHTSKTRGSVYSTLEEIIDLEYSTKQENQPESMSRLLRETIKSSELKKHCQQALDDGHASNQTKNAAYSEKRLGDCKKILQLLLRANCQEAIELTLSLIDDCNKQLTTRLRHEELGYGPGARYYRRWRQQFIEILSDISRPKESLLDRLMSRLHYNFAPVTPATTSGASSTGVSVNGIANGRTLRRSSNSNGRAQSSNDKEFTMLNTSSLGKFNNVNSSNNKHNKGGNNDTSFVTDDTNNNDGDGSIVMTITNLATKPSVSQEKRVDISVKLLNVLRNTTCSLYDGPDLDILESISNLNTVVQEIVPKIVHLAKKCRHQDQYTVACIHAAQGQLQSGLVQRWLLDLIKTPNVTCMVKSEIVSTLITVSSVQELMILSSMSGMLPSKQAPTTTTTTTAMGNSIPSKGDGAWPHYGLNQLDNTLLDMVSSASNGKSSLVARKCLKKHVIHYIRSKHSSVSKSEEILQILAQLQLNQQVANQDPVITINQRASRNVPPAPATNHNPNRAVWHRSQLMDLPVEAPVSIAAANHYSAMFNQRQPYESHYGQAINRRYKRYITKDFWDEATCKRWSYDLSDKSSTNYLPNNEDGWMANNEDNSIYASLANSNKTTLSSSRRKNGLLLLEREDSLDASLKPSSEGYAGSNVSRRQKCTGTRTYGPKNAEATIKAEIVNDIVGPNDDNKFLARFTVAANFLGSKVDIGRMYLWHQRQTTRAYVNMFGKTLWDTSHSCHDKTPRHLLYMPLFDFNIWVVKINVGIRLHSEMGFYSSCRQQEQQSRNNNDNNHIDRQQFNSSVRDELHLFPTIGLRASGEASAKFVVARAGMSIGSHYSYQGQIKITRKPESCMSISSGHEPMNVTFSSWYQLWNNDCQYWGSRTRGQPHAVKWSINKRRSTTWVSDECLGLPSNRSVAAKIEP